jgi:pimeloyl-ACP methyl ester carboxylesterase
MPKKEETVQLNGSNIYYEVYGEGEPLFLLHGFTQSSRSWHQFVADYEKDFEVYLVDLKGHGKSDPFREKISIRSAADDLNALISYLKLESISAIGYSYGGEVLFQLALIHPGLLKSMIIIGSCGSWNAKDFPQWVEYLSYNNIDNLPWMREQQTSEEQIKLILDQMPNYNVFVSDEELKSIQSRVLFVWGDQDDSTPLECIARSRSNLQNSFLWVLPNTGHGAHKDKKKAEFVKMSKEFLKERWSK